MKIRWEDETLFTGTFKFDGYVIGGRLLEGVFFHADAVDGIVDFDSIRVAPDAVDYFSGLNQKKWLNAAKRNIKEETEAFDTLDGKDNVWVDLEDDEKSTSEPEMVSMMSMSDIINPK